jgi:hypothetical protein
LELCTARVITATGYRSVSGMGTVFLQYLLAAVLLARGTFGSLRIADGALDSQLLYRYAQPGLPQDEAVALAASPQKCRELSSRICRSKAAKAHLLRRIGVCSGAAKRAMR